jgi:hypothetical protein
MVSRTVWRRVALWACLLLPTATALGLVHPVPTAEASCAGPRLDLWQAGIRVVPHRMGEGVEEKRIFSIDRDLDVVVVGSNLTVHCHDIGSGCGASQDEVIRPLQDAVLVLRQDGREWQLAKVGEIGPDLKAEVSIALPSGVEPGAATLAIMDPHEDSGTRLDLELI